MSCISKRFKLIKNMRPPKMWIDGVSFNVGRTNLHSEKVKAKLPDQHELFKINVLENEKFSTCFKVPQKYCNIIIANPDFTLDEFEEYTKTKLNVEKTGSIDIIGNDYDAVANAREEMHCLIENIRNRSKPLQFLAIPTLGDEIKTNFDNFQEEILSYSHVNPIKGMHKSIFQDPNKLHLTIIVMSLLDDREITEAVNLLHSHKKDLMEVLKKHSQPTIMIQGIDCMQANYKKVNVLFAKASLENESDEVTLQKIVNKISNCFYEKGFAKENKTEVKLHLTLINTTYRGEGYGRRQWNNKRQPFDASWIMENYNNYIFGKTPLKNIQLCLMSSKGQDGFYEKLAEIELI